MPPTAPMMRRTSIPENEKTKYQFTGKGTVTEIYIDDADAWTVTVVEINYYLGQVSKVKDDDSKGELCHREAPSPTEPKSLDDNALSMPRAIEEDDYVVFTVDYNEDEDFYICELMAPETVNGEVTRVEKDKDRRDRQGRDRRDLSEAAPMVPSTATAGDEPHRL